MDGYGTRMPISDGATYLCLQNRGFPVANLDQFTINEVPRTPQMPHVVDSLRAWLKSPRDSPTPVPFSSTTQSVAGAITKKASSATAAICTRRRKFRSRVAPANATQISAGTDHTCALIADASVRCWGDNQYGQLGDGTTTNSPVPLTVSGITDATEIVVGGEHTCALIADASVRCWGDNQYGQLGDGTTTNSPVPLTVSGITDATEIVAGGEHTCALLVDHTLRCWGENQQGQLGDGTTMDLLTPVAVVGITAASQVSAGSYHTCALLVDQSVRCLGP